MAVLKAKDLRDMEPDQLVEHVRATRAELFGLRFQHATGELEDTSGLGSAKRGVARALTVCAERGIDVEKELSR